MSETLTPNSNFESTTPSDSSPWDSLRNLVFSAFGKTHKKNIEKNHNLESKEATPQKDPEFQKIYEESKTSDEYGFYESTMKNHNLETGRLYFATGQSCYYNEQADRDGLCSLKMSQEDIADANFIINCFGGRNGHQPPDGEPPKPRSEDKISVLYTTLPGSTELLYASQSFPAFIFEDVFGCGADHIPTISPKVGEEESDFYLRLLGHRIDTTDGFPSDKREQVLMSGKRLIDSFCSKEKGKNRIYLIPYENIQDNVTTYGDVPELRGTGASKTFARQFFADKRVSEEKYGYPTLKEIVDERLYGEKERVYEDPNFTSEYGVVIYDDFPQDGIKYFEVERAYDIAQDMAKNSGLKPGEEIPEDIFRNASGPNSYY